MTSNSDTALDLLREARDALDGVATMTGSPRWDLAIRIAAFLERPQEAGDVQRLTRELDVLLNGEANAAPQASLCDIVSQVASIVRKTGKPVLSVEPGEPHPDTARLDWLIADYRLVDLYYAVYPHGELTRDGAKVREAIDKKIAEQPVTKEIGHE